MAELQTFSNQLGVAEVAAPSQQPGDATLLANATSGLLSMSQKLIADEQERKRKSVEMSNDAAIAQGSIYAESFKRREPLSEAVAAGHLTEEQAKNFGIDQAKSLEALNQASAQGMGGSIRNALERSVRYQFAAMQNPGAAKELAQAYGINDNSVEQDTLASLEKVEREQLKEDADEVRKLAREEGYSDFYDRADEEVLDMWASSPAARRELEIRQSQRRALAHEVGLKERSPHAAKALSLDLSTANNEMNKLQMEFLASTGGQNLGSDGTSMSFAEQLSFWAEDKIAEASRIYADFPSLLKEYAEGIRSAVNSRVQARRAGLEAGRAEHEAQVQRPLEVARLQEDLIRDRFSNSQNPITAMRNQVNLNKTIAEEQTRIASLADDVANAGPGESMNFMKEYLNSPVNQQRMALLSTGVAEGSALMMHKLIDPVEGSYKENVDAATATLAHIVRQGGVNGNEASLKKAIKDFSLAHEYNVEASPSKAKSIESNVLKLAEDPKFVKMAEDSPAVRQLLRPYSEGIKTRIIDSMRETMNKAATDTVSAIGHSRLPGSNASRFALWRKVGPNMVLDKAATNQAGVPQYKLVDNIQEQYGPEDIEAHAEVIGEYNRDLQFRESAKEYTLLKNLTGSKDVATALEMVINSDEGMALSTLNPERRAEDRKEVVRNRTRGQVENK